MNANLIFHKESFEWNDLHENRATQLEDFILLIDFIRDKDDKIYNNEEIFSLKLKWGNFNELIYSDNIECKWLSLTLKQALQSILAYQPVESFESLKRNHPEENNGQIGFSGADGVVFDQESWYSFHFRYLKKNPQVWDWGYNEYFPNQKYWASLNESKENIIAYSDLVIIEFMEKNYPQKFPTEQDKLNGFQNVALGNGGKFRNLSKQEKLKMSQEILERNFYNYENAITQDNKKYTQNNRKIYSISKNGNNLFLSIDHENFLFEVHNEKGKHLGAINFRGELIQAPDKSGKHDIIL
ncbi:MAG: hypothetical protein N3A69_04010 [Leptospiraceae bacterium]|nr:hypothetical protein [Leptospiraceae bacterium]